ncbi:XrtA/PEP-CTERM system histidine kinase PrsK [Massilia glaciei]|uniref:histidine kinase n=1 Tax=Massilia glaciei TaxID=1524097 RepID=A0A2U2HJF4_9BURK|nr:XrtA/PEP-CTERM system histidine kinase PrsK [Massilia glaciei]PWF47667.1 PEP-CTERM system histidine kinase PrsK [Massilia glaciei]
MQAVVLGFSHGIAALGFLMLFLVLAGRWRARVHAAALALACLVSALWSGALASGLGAIAGAPLETVRTCGWAALLLMLIGPARARWKLCLGLILALGAASLGGGPPMAVIGARLMLSVLGMLLVEQLYRNTPVAERWAIKFACIGVGALFGYDFFLYSDAALFSRINPEIDAARGIANALTVPLLAVSAARNPAWASGMALSRRLMFHSAALIGSAIYLLAMALSAYYLRFIGGDWGRVMQFAFLCGACIVLAGVLFSGALRARLKVMINKHLYTSRFDYREEWWRFTRVLSEDGPDLNLRAIAAVAGLVESPAGALWLRRDGDMCEAAGAWNMPSQSQGVDVNGDFFAFIESRQWVVDAAGEARANPHPPLPGALLAVPDLWVVVPLTLHGRLFGLVALARPRAPLALNWEVTDVLKIAGSQAASYLAHRESLNSLLVARQFESFNRVSTFIVHDLKNLVCQFSLLLANADKHKHNPEFQADVLGTLDHSVRKMQTLLQKLGRGDPDDASQPQRLARLLEQAVEAKSLAEPRPALVVRDPALFVLAHRGRLERVLGHLIQNAIEATSRHGEVAVRLLREGDCAVVEVADTGLGMSAGFMREGLFKPFVTTKTAGMGIGVFESREYIRELGGELQVASAESEGTTFRVILPLHDMREALDGQEEVAGH